MVRIFWTGEFHQRVLWIHDHNVVQRTQITARIFLCLINHSRVQIRRKTREKCWNPISTEFSAYLLCVFFKIVFSLSLFLARAQPIVGCASQFIDLRVHRFLFVSASSSLFSFIPFMTNLFRTYAKTGTKKSHWGSMKKSTRKPQHI